MAASRQSALPRIALTLGDPSGISPEIVRAALLDERVAAALEAVVLGPQELRIPGCEVVESVADLQTVERKAGRNLWLDSSRGKLGSFEMGHAQKDCGRAALDALRLGADLGLGGQVDGLVTAPVCKEAMHMAGEKVEGQTELLRRWASADRCQMMAIAGDMRVLMATRHMSTVAAIASLTPKLILDSLELLHESMVGFGFDAPHLAVAGVNPHASEGGLFGDDEQRVLMPAIKEARAKGFHVTGPEPPDTIFVAAAAGKYDAVLALYHDQGFIPVKLAAPTTGVTVLLGMPYLRVSPAHGTAFDIAGQGVASPENLITALLQAAAWIPEAI
ncbi:MAG: 4-hydroxythreonine-4-phosphate dehydrogenase [Bacteroidia bacterium]|jgi:4-hydroxythreonine-4-phosphate dehydrogenase